MTNAARKKPSPRAELAERLYHYLVNSGTFTAPYGILEGWHIPENKRGKARTITFGFARTLDATLFIWSASYLLLKTNREEEKFTSEQAFYDYCADHYGTPRVLCAEVK